MRTKIRVLAVLVIVGYHLLLVTVAFAIPQPDADPTITAFYANVNLRETGDVLIYGEYNFPYASVPDTTADSAYSLRLFDTDNVTELGAILPFPSLDNGYNEGAFGFYFPASDNLTTGEAYIIRISQSPAFFDSPESFDYIMPASAWTSFSTSSENQLELYVNIVAIAESLEAAHTDLTLLESSAGGTVLSSPVGETYFRGVINGIQTMAPTLFLVQVYTFETGDRAWTTDEFDAYQARFSGTWLGTTTANTSATFGLTTPSLMSVLFGLPIILGAVIISTIKFKRIDPALLVASLVLILLALMGWVSIALFGLIYQLMAIYIGYLWFYARS